MKKERKEKKPNLEIPGRKKYSSLKEYLKDLEDTMAKLHVETMDKVMKGRK